MEITPQWFIHMCVSIFVTSHEKYFNSIHFLRNMSLQASKGRSLWSLLFPATQKNKTTIKGVLLTISEFLTLSVVQGGKFVFYKLSINTYLSICSSGMYCYRVKTGFNSFILVVLINVEPLNTRNKIISGIKCVW